MAQQFTDQNFATDVIEMSKTKPVLVDFYADWCGPCKMQGPIVEEVSNIMGDKASVGKLNTEANMMVSMSYNVMSIPTLLIFRNGGVVKQLVGVQSQDTLVAVLKENA